MTRKKTHPLFGIAILLLTASGIQSTTASSARADEATGNSGVAAASTTDQSAQSPAPSPVASPGETIEAFHAGLLEIMKHANQLGIQGRIDQLTPLMSKTFDLEFMASKTVGRHWRKLSDEDKTRWVETFKDFTCANYAGRFTGFTGEKFVTTGAEDAASGTRVVLTKIVIPDDEDVQLNYRLIQRDGVWRVIDVFLNGSVSELALRRSEYSSTLKRDGFASLVQSVEDKIADLKSKDSIEG
ncbi:MAG: ABC transporter substrate-binding protein [Myxococcales bacterium]